MSLAPFIAASPTVQFHAAAAIIALLSAIGVAFLSKGTPAHVWLGRSFALAIMITAVSSFWITGLTPGHYSWIHILSVVTIINVPLAIRAIWRGDRRGHARAMIINAVSLAIAGAFTLMPGRILGAVVFGP